MRAEIDEHHVLAVELLGAAALAVGELQAFKRILGGERGYEHQRGGNTQMGMHEELRSVAGCDPAGRTWGIMSMAGGGQ